MHALDVEDEDQGGVVVRRRDIYLFVPLCTSLILGLMYMATSGVHSSYDENDDQSSLMPASQALRSLGGSRSALSAAELKVLQAMLNFTGSYSDSNDPNSTRAISLGKIPGEVMISGGNSTAARSWVLTGTITPSGKGLLVDFSSLPRGGPADMIGTLLHNRSGIRWQDGKIWKRRVAKVDVAGSLQHASNQNSLQLGRGAQLHTLDTQSAMPRGIHAPSAMDVTQV